MERRPKWLALGYSVPASPSKLRVYVWRKLKELGVQYFKPTVAILPNNTSNLKSLEHLGQKIREIGGEAWIIEMNFITMKDNQEMAQRFDAALDREKEDFLTDCSTVLQKLEEAKSDEQKTQLLFDLKKIAKLYEKNISAGTGESVLHEMEQAMLQLREGMHGMREELSSMIKLWNKITSRS